jgi:transcriptional regulator with XRE-family HTH domain
MTIGDEIRAEREARGWTRERLAARAKMPLRWVEEVEDGRRRPHRSGMPLLAIANAFEVEVEELLALCDQGPFLEERLMRAEHHERCGILWDWASTGTVSRLVLCRLLDLAWTTDEAPRRNQRVWLRLFREAGFTTDTWQRLTGELTIYRGTAGGERSPGMAWTLDEASARWFARRSAMTYRRNPTVYRARVHAEDVLAYFAGRNEQEVVVDPATLSAREIFWRDDAPHDNASGQRGGKPTL